MSLVPEVALLSVSPLLLLLPLCVLSEPDSAPP